MQSTQLNTWIEDQYILSRPLDALPLDMPQQDHPDYSYDSLFYHPPPPPPAVYDPQEEIERELALRFILHEMRDWCIDDEDRRSRYAKSIPVCPPSPTPSSSFSSTPPASPTRTQLRLSGYSSVSSFQPFTVPESSEEDEEEDDDDISLVHIPPRTSSLPQTPTNSTFTRSPSSPYIPSPSPSPSSSLHTSRWSVSTTALNTPAPPSTRASRASSASSFKLSFPSLSPSPRASTPAPSIKSTRSLPLPLRPLHKLASLTPLAYRRRKLLIRGVPPDDDPAFASVRAWCDALGPGAVARVARQSNGDIHVHFARAAVADALCRLHGTQVAIRGAGSVTLSYFTGKRPASA